MPFNSALSPSSELRPTKTWIGEIGGMGLLMHLFESRGLFGSTPAALERCGLSSLQQSEGVSERKSSETNNYGA